jgi:uncharacterized membrane protein HdeD (DUF308 family)
MSLVPRPDRAALLSAERESLRKVWFLLLILGIALIIVGLVAMSCLFSATMAGVYAIGTLFVIGGAIEVVNAFFAYRWRGFWMHLLAGVLYLVLGVVILRRPVAAVETFTLVIAAAFMIGGSFRIIASIVQRYTGWVWVLINGIVTLVLGAMIWESWPESAYWVIGLFLGIELLFAGWSWVLTAIAVRTLAKPAV